ncbi:MAG: hypothetical protein M5U28_17970 [Sandaracinaceae bacterium]|nr:hypothetical protein [Sandaracinaceae bacterium]
MTDGASRQWLAEDVHLGLHAAGATVGSLPKLGRRAAWLLEPGFGLVGALRVLQTDALDGDAIIVAALGLPFEMALSWGHGCVGSFAPPADVLLDDGERALRVVAEWCDRPDDRWAWEAHRLSVGLGLAVPAGWLAHALSRLVEPPGMLGEAGRLAARHAVLAAVGLAAAEADADRFGPYPARLALCADLALAIARGAVS